MQVVCLAELNSKVQNSFFNTAAAALQRQEQTLNRRFASLRAIFTLQRMAIMITLSLASRRKPPVQRCMPRNQSLDLFAILPLERQALNSICDHVDDIESVLRTELEADRDDDEQIGAGKKGDASEPSQGRTSSGIVHGGMIDRDAMARKLARARGKKVRV